MENILADNTIKAIFLHYENQKQRFSSRIGASIIGHKCDRYLWMNFHWTYQEPFPGRVLRLFDTGHREEERIINDLRNAGVTVHDVDDKTEKQFVLTGANGHLVCKMDGACLGILDAPKTWHVLECKTSNDRNFKSLINKGVEKAQPKHYAQCQVGMHLSGMTRAYYIAQNKNTDDLYAERIHYNKEHSQALEDRVSKIVELSAPPDRIGGPSYWECKWCQFKDVCHYDQLPMMNCRTCCYSTPANNGEWQCERNNLVLTLDKQNEGCEQHLFNPMIINAKLVDYQSEECVQYTTIHDVRFCNAPVYAFPEVDGKNSYDFILPSDKMSGLKIGDLL